MALTPKTPTDGANAENISAKTPPKSPNIPPIIASTISRVLDFLSSKIFPPLNRLYPYDVRIK